MAEDSSEKGLVHVTPMAIAEVEGEMIRRMEGKLPGITLPMDYGYPRNTHLLLQVEARVQSILIDEIKSGDDKGQLLRRHNLIFEQVKIVGVYTAEQMEQGVGGSASASAVAKEEEEHGREPAGPEGPSDESADPGF